MTLQGKPAANRCAISKLEAATGKTQQKLGRPRKARKKGSAIVSVHMAEEDVIMLCFDPPRKYDTVIHFLQNHLKNRMLELAPVGGTADVEDEDDKKEEAKKGKKNENEKKGKKDKKGSPQKKAEKTKDAASSSSSPVGVSTSSSEGTSDIEPSD